MKLLRCFQILAIILIFLIITDSHPLAYEPMPDETIFKISNLSDTFIYGEVRSKTHFLSMKGRPRTLHKIKVLDVLFDKVGIASGKDEVEIITNEGFITNQSGIVEKFKELNTPTLSINCFYLLYLRWDSAQNGFILTSGETSVFEVDEQGKVLNFDGVYLLDVKEGRPVFGMPKASKMKELMEKERERDPGPVATVTDIYGRTQVIEPSPKWFQARQEQDVSTDLYLTIDQFLEKVEEVKK